MHYYPEFKKSQLFTIGIEVEFQLINKKSLNLEQCASQVLKEVEPNYREKIKPEFIQSMVEVTTGICQNLEEAEKDLKNGIKELERVLNKLDYLFFASSLHPFAKCKEQKLSSDKRYYELMNEFQIVGRRLITQGLHVHIGIDDADKATKVVDKMRTYLPLLLAISASSPFFESEDTGLCSFRSKLFDALPRSGIADALISWENFQVLADLLYQARIINSARDIWWDIRPHPIFGTVEIRICDVPSTFFEIMALVAFIRVLVEYCYKNEGISPQVHRSILINNKWNACRYGLKGIFVNPFTLEKNTIQQSLQLILKETEDLFQELRADSYLKILEEMQLKGCSANLQRQLVAKHRGDFKLMIKEMIKEFWK